MPMRVIVSTVVAVVVSLPFLITGAKAEQETLGLKIDDVMSARELKDTGISGLTPSQREALNAWLNRYTAKVLKVAPTQSAKEPASPKSGTKSDCVPAVESTIEGDFNGWDGETIFKLDNGEIWEQEEYDYFYSYSYRPDVTIYQTDSGCRMKVADVDETILVRRIK
jgi:hypothetical protein